MITDELIKNKFISDIIQRDIKLIYNTQEEVICSNFSSGTGRLAAYLSQKPFTLNGDGLKPVYYMRIFSYLRFLDIHYRHQQKTLRNNLSLYNRVVWGILYNETLPDLRYAFTAEIRNKIRTQLELLTPEELQDIK